MTRSRFQVGDWWADPATNELCRDGKSLRVEPKVMEVLLVLARRAGEVVSRDELLSMVWPGVVVGDEALTQSIIKLRKALGDNPRAPAYVETISKRGYRLIVPVRDAASAQAACPDGQTGAPSSTRPRNMRRVALAVTVLALAVSAGSFYLSQKDSTGIEAADAWDASSHGLVVVEVLPFEWLGATDEHAYLARGISMDLMTDLSRLPGLRLVSRSTAKPAPARDAHYLVSGSVQRESGLLRVNVRLVDARSGDQLWSERFERPFQDLFSVQTDVVRSLIEKLPAKVSAAERARVAKRYTRSLEAYEQFLRGQALFMVRRTEDNEEARSYFRRAIELDPKFARAYASLAMTHAMEYRLQPSGGASPSLARAFEFAETARLIDPDIAEIHWALGFVHVQGRRHHEAIRSLRKALELDRSYADAYALLGGIHTYMGQAAKTIPLLRTAMRLNPEGGYLYFQILGRAYLFENDIEQALINLRAAAARNPVDLETRVYLAAALAAAGNRPEAEWEVMEIRVLSPGFSTRDWLGAYPMTSAEHAAKLSALLAQAGL